MGEDSFSVNVRIEDPDGNVVEEKMITVTPGDSLVYQWKTEKAWMGFMGMPFEQREQFQGAALDVLKKRGGVIFLPPFVDLKVLRKEF